MTEKRLHIGCGKAYLPGFINVDIFSSVRADVYADMTALPFDRGTFDELYASHVLEHCHRHLVLATLSHWRDLLKPDGIVRIAVPDFEACVKWYNNGGSLDDITGLLWGGQNHPKNNHFIGFDIGTLTTSLHKAGFKDVKKWNWRETDHAEHDDYSQAYLPSMQKQTGLLMSLNLQARKK